MLKVPKGTNYIGTLYYYAVDQFGNDSRTKTRRSTAASPWRSTTRLARAPSSATRGLRQGLVYHPSPATGSEAYYAWDSSNENAFA